MGILWSDLRYSIRLLSRSPWFTLSVVVVLALGIGANSAMFTALDQTVIRPLPFADPGRLTMLWEDFSAFGTPTSRISPATFLDLQKRTHTFEQIAAYSGLRNMNLSGTGAPEEVLGLSVSANLLPALGVPPMLGRTFSEEEQGPETKAVVLSYRLWQQRFGGDRAIAGASIVLNDEKHTVIGVMPRGFTFPNERTALWMPLGLTPEVLARRNSHFLKVFGRLRPGSTIALARAEMGAIAKQLAREFPATNDKIGIIVTPFKDEILGGTGTAFTILLSAAACVLLIACANVGNLLLARGTGRRQEIAVRIALGASPARLLRQILTENLLLASAGGGLGILLANWCIRALQPMVPAGLAELRIDARVLAFSVAVSILTGLLFGFAPAFQLMKAGLAGRGTIGHGARRLRDLMVVAELAIALVLVTGAALLIETLIHMRAVDPGFRPEKILTADVSVPYPKYAESGKRQRFYTDMLAKVMAIPGVSGAGLTSDLPYTSRGNTMGLTIEGRPMQPGLGQDALFRMVSSAYLQTIGAKLKEGRFLDASDRTDSTPSAVVNESLARQYWPGESAIGHRIDTGTGDGQRRWMTIVGVVGEIRERGLDFASKPAVYVPFDQTSIAFFQPSEIAILTAREPLLSIVKELQQAVWAVDSEQPVSQIRPMSEIVDAEFASRTQVLEMLGLFAVLALVLAGLGIYSVLSYVVSQRTREIGLRMAIGADQWSVVRTIGGYAAKLTGAGLGVGVAIAAGTTRLLSSLLYGVSPLEWRIFSAVAAGLALVALLAAFLPARRAAAVDPIVALREE